jgi:hypothetical protein
MDARARLDHAHRSLDLATAARQRGDGAACLQHLEQAYQLAEGDAALVEKVAWRLSKAAFDFGTITQAFDALSPILAAPFAYSSGPRSAVPELCTRWWDECGYRDPRPYQLWRATVESWRADGDPWMAAAATSRLAWGYACAGAWSDLDAVVEGTLQLDPRTFGEGPHKHPRAPDTPSSVWWAHIEVLRTALWATAWTPRPARAIDWLDAAADALAGASLPEDGDLWLLDASMRAAIANGLDVAPARQKRWLHQLSDHAGPRGAFHRSIGQGVLAAQAERADEASNHFAHAARIAREHRLGPEWEADALLRRADLGDAQAQEQGQHLVDHFGLLGLRAVNNR